MIGWDRYENVMTVSRSGWVECKDIVTANRLIGLLI